MHVLAFVLGVLTLSPHGILSTALHLGGDSERLVHALPSEFQAVPGIAHDVLKRQQYTDLGYTGPRTFQNRYFINDTYYEEGGPVIWYDYGEAGVTDAGVHRFIGEANGTTAPMELARQYRGLVVLWELRYFGYSLPFPLNISNNTGFREPVGAPATWKYNTLDQGLADAAYFASNIDQGDYQRDNMTALLARNTPWIFIGGSYPDVRAANIRARKPEAFYAAWSSSAPVEALYDGSAFYNGAELSLYPNCSTDVRAAVKYADEVMSGKHGPDAYSHLQRLTYAATSLSLSSYNASRAASTSQGTIASIMSTPFSGTFTNSGHVNTTWLFCDAFESFNPNATGYNTNDTYLSVVTNPGNALAADNGFLASHGNNQTLLLEAYFYGYARYSNFSTVFLAEQRSKFRQTPDGRADGAAWEYLVNTQVGWFQGSNPNNISIISTYLNFTSLIPNRRIYTFSNATLASFPARPDTATFNRLGGWRINPTNTMFTSGAWDPWRPGTVFSLDTEIGAPGLQPSEQIPACGARPSDPNTRFGIVYPQAVHVPDLFEQPDVYGTGPDSPFERGLGLFMAALDVWLPCFGNGTSNGTLNASAPI